MRHLMPVLLVVLWSIFSEAADPQPDDTLKHVADSRRAIESGEVLVLSVDYDRVGTSDELMLSRVMKYEIAFQGEKQRTVQSAGRPIDGVPDTFSKEDALNTGERIYHRTFDLSVPTNKIAIPFAHASDADHWKKHKIYVFDPRVFGLFTGPFATMHAYSIGDFVNGIPESTDVRDVELDGVGVRLMSYKKNIFTHRLWISPKQGWNVLRSEWIDPGRRRVTLTSKIEQFNEIWFPREMVYEEFDGTDKLTERNVAKIVTATFNREIKADRFELSGMQLSKGTLIFNAAKPGHAEEEWDGEQLQPRR